MSRQFAETESPDKYQAVKFNFTTNLTGIGNRSEEVMLHELIYLLLIISES